MVWGCPHTSIINKQMSMWRVLHIACSLDLPSLWTSSLLYVRSYLESKSRQENDTSAKYVCVRCRC